MIEDRIRKKIADLIDRSSAVGGDGIAHDSQQLSACKGWIAEAVNIIEVAIPSPQSAYRRHVEKTADGGGGIAVAVLSIAEILRGLISDIDAGLISSVENEVTAETFDDLIDHAQAYLGEGRKDPAGAIVGVVFEDTLHRLCRKHGIDDAGQTCDPLIRALVSAGVLTKLQAKEATTAAGLRTSATHARWEEFTAQQVEAVISFTRRLIRENLAG